MMYGVVRVPATHRSPVEERRKEIVKTTSSKVEKMPKLPFATRPREDARKKELKNAELPRRR